MHCSRFHGSPGFLADDQRHAHTSHTRTDGPAAGRALDLRCCRLQRTSRLQATTLFTNAATANATVHANLKTAHTALKTAVQGNDTAAINQAATTIGNLEGQSVANTSLADAAFYSILTADQKTKFASLGGHGQFGGGFGPGYRMGH